MYHFRLLNVACQMLFHEGVRQSVSLLYLQIVLSTLLSDSEYMGIHSSHLYMLLVSDIICFFGTAVNVFDFSFILPSITS